jgi:uncharacterized glyoxalase superfamily protein PhnB
MWNARNSITEMRSALRLDGSIPDKGIGAVSRSDVGPIFFRKRTPPFEPAIHWVFAEDIDASYQELKSSGANIVDPLELKPWGLRQFTVKDLGGNLFYFHHD